jgi:DNA-binding FadR family transcriptional regulator
MSASLSKPNKKDDARPKSQQFAPFELIQARLLIESEVAAQAALCRTDQDVEQLEVLLDQMVERSEKKQNPLEADRAFHSVLARASGNQVLASMVDQLFDARMGVLFSRLSNYFDTRITWDQAIKEHRAIVRAIKARDADKARLAMRHHMERAYKRFSASWVKSNSDHKLVGNATLNLSAKGAKPGKIPG